MANINNITHAKPLITGAISIATVGTTLPTTAEMQLDTKFANLGYISEDGLTNNSNLETENIKAWGGDIVLTIQKGKEDTFETVLIESLNIDVLKLIYGKDNVTGTLQTGITIKSNSTPLDNYSFVIDMILKGGVLKRIVIPFGTLSEIGEIEYSDSDSIKYPITITAMADGQGVTHYEYIKKKVGA